MKLQLLYKSKDEGAYAIEQYVNDYLRQRPDRELALVDADSKEGSRFSELYGIVDYPVILATSDDGSLIRLWQGKNLPQFDDLSSYSS